MGRRTFAEIRLKSFEVKTKMEFYVRWNFSHNFLVTFFQFIIGEKFLTFVSHFVGYSRKNKINLFHLKIKFHKFIASLFQNFQIFRIYGSDLYLRSLETQSSLPELSHALFSFFLYGAVISFTGIPFPERVRLIENIFFFSMFANALNSVCFATN